MRVVKTDKELWIETQRARNFHSKGLKVDLVRYEGPKGRYTMRFNGHDFELDRLDPDYVQIDWDSLEASICRPKKTK